MNFGLSSLGRLFSGVRGFYNEINSATLTGAIDVIIIKQEDGTYTSSPFHVRFGKLGVLRSRQKVVDITINGVPVEDVHMKLGEAGEAFFVEMVEEDAEIDENILDQLATSPIPIDGAALMEQGLAELRSRSKKEEAAAASMEGAVLSKAQTFRSSVSLTLQDLTAESEHAAKSDSSHDEMSGAEESRRKVLKKRRSRVGKGSPRSLIGPDAERGQMFEMEVSGTESSEEELSKTALLANQLKEESNLGLDAFSGHPLSDPELSPIGSPLPTRPPSPKSDSEVDKQRQGASQSELLMGESTQWEWGGFPQTASAAEANKESRSPPAPPQSDPPGSTAYSPLQSDLPDSGPSSSGSESAPSKEGEHNGSAGAALTAKAKEEAKSKLEPKYLSELDLEDPEVAKLYLSSISRFETIREKEEDAESGRGASLPQSPHSVDGAVCGPSSVSFLQSEVRHLGTFSLSLCGGLGEPEELNLEKFMLKVITYDDLCENPAIVKDPDLVVKVNNKYYNWATAAPMVLSKAVYHKDLSEKAVKKLVKEHMPRKEKKKKGGLSWFWRRTQQDETEASESSAPEPSPQAGSDPNKPAVMEAVPVSVTDTSGVEGATTVTATDTSTTSTTPAATMPLTASSAESLGTAFVSMGAANTLAPDSSETAAVSSTATPRLSVSEGDLPVPSEGTTPRPSYTEVMTGRVTSLSSSPVSSSSYRDQHSSDGDTDGSERISSPEFSPPSSPPRRHSPDGSGLLNSILGTSSPDRRDSSESSGSPSSSVDPSSPSPVTLPASSSPTKEKSHTPPASPNKDAGGSPSADSTVVDADTIVVDMTESGQDPVPSVDPNVVEVTEVGAVPKATVVTMEEAEEDAEKEHSQAHVDAATSVKPEQPPQRKKEKYIKTLRLSSSQIAKLNLHEGVNEIIYSVTTAYQGTTRCCSHIFLWQHDDKIVISDIDGTITRSDVLGQILPIIGKDWSQFGVANLFTRISNNGYKLLYLSARAIGQSRATKELLKNIRQDNSQVLPLGPLLLNPTSLLSAFHREVIVRKPEEFKINCLKDIADLFPCNPFYAGFGNKINDVWTYQALEIPRSRTFTINHRGELTNEVNQTYQSSYSQMSSIADHVFPPIHRVSAEECLEFSTVNYWRMPLPPIDIIIEEIGSPETTGSDSPKSAPSSPKK